MSHAALERRLADARDAYVAAARKLSAGRRAAASSLDATVTALMQGLGMPGGVFAARVEAQDPPEFSANGNDDVEFMVSANPGSRPARWRRSPPAANCHASAWRCRSRRSKPNTCRCLVFDEVDAGVGGAVAEMVGRQLRALAANGQVLCVTHLPQVACQAEHQLRVSKHVVDGATRTRIEVLDATARVEEIARMLGGTQITDRTREHAREMLDASETAQANTASFKRNAVATARRAASTRASSGTGKPRGRNGRAG